MRRRRGSGHPRRPRPPRAARCAARRAAGRAAGGALAALLATGAAAGAQAPGRTLAIDNDWLVAGVPAHARTDRDYTHGTHWTSERLDAPLAALVGALPFLGRNATCADADPEGDRAAPCLRTTLAFGQAIYTGRTWDPAPDDRPNAGWLAGRLTTRAVAPHRERALRVELGVTGPAAFGGPVQQAMHRLVLGERVGRPAGWEEQLPFELAGAVGIAERRLVRVAGTTGVGSLLLLPGWDATLGTLRTAAGAGLEAVAGVGLDHPFHPGALSPAAWSLYAIAGVRGELVAHDLFLDGGLAGGGRRVARIPGVATATLGAGVRAGRLRVEYRQRWSSRTFRTQPGGHRYGSVRVGVEVRAGG